jgi:hypothetical protein
VPALTSSNGGPWLIPLVFYVFFRSSQTSIDYRTHFHLNYLSDLASSGTLRLLGHINIVGLNISCTIAELAQKLHQDHVQVNMKLMKNPPRYFDQLESRLQKDCEDCTFGCLGAHGKNLARNMEDFFTQGWWFQIFIDL